MLRIRKTLYILGALTMVGAVASTVAPPVIAQVRAALVRDVDHPARSSFLYTADVSLTPGNSLTGVLTAVIPAGKKLVLEFVTVSCFGDNDERLQILLRMRQQDGSFSRYLRLPVESDIVPGFPALSWAAAHSVRLYADAHPDGSVEVSVGRGANDTGNTGCVVNLSGFTVDAQ